MQIKNSKKIKGVYRLIIPSSSEKYGRRYCYAFWEGYHTDNEKKLHKRFSCNNYGEETAKTLAIIFKKEGISGVIKYKNKHRLK